MQDQTQTQPTALNTILETDDKVTVDLIQRRLQARTAASLSSSEILLLLACRLVTEAVDMTNDVAADALSANDVAEFRKAVSLNTIVNHALHSMTAACVSEIVNPGELNTIDRGLHNLVHELAEHVPAMFKLDIQFNALKHDAMLEGACPAPAA